MILTIAFMMKTQCSWCVPVCADNCALCDTAEQCTTCNNGYRVNKGSKKCDIGQFVFIPLIVYFVVSNVVLYGVWCVVGCLGALGEYRVRLSKACNDGENLNDVVGQCAGGELWIVLGCRGTL